MKCPSCLNLIADGDDVCPVCHTPFRWAKSAALDHSPKGGEWGFLFAVACGVIPVLTLGGAVPVLLGFGGASGCWKLARATHVPLVLRFLGCVAITAGCWALLAAALAVVSGLLRR